MRWPAGGMILWLLFLAGSVSARLPASFDGWESRAVQTISTTQLSSVAGPDSALLREYGFLGGERREYTRENSKLTVTLWRMKDTTGSFGLFTFYREPGMTSGQTEDLVATGSGVLLLQRGPYLLVARGESLSADQSPSLAAEIPQPDGREGLLPPLPAYLPEEGLVAQSQKFLIGPVAFERLKEHLPASALGFEFGAEAALARYRIEGGEARLLLVSYPTPQLAAKMLRSFQELPALAEGELGRNVFIQRKSSLIAFVLDAPDLAAAEKLLDRVRYETTIMWNEYVPTRKDNLAHMLITIFSLAGLVLLFSFVAGVAFGGVRILVKRFVPIPIFDRPSQMEIIQLHLSDK